ncbi:MAG: hypothetical protein C0592_00590 [Marinilabiliales bacterium]|nr:MAG: hypothetical protein C0592_00590 [Marinilabiliales bacterium]
MEQKLNLGCGTDIKEGWVNLDVSPLEGVDVVHDVNTLPLPFEDELFDYILCQDILEHIEYIPVLKELHRIMKKGGIIEIRVPHFTSRINYIDPTHKKRFSIETFDFFTSKAPNGRDYYFDFHFEKVIYKQIWFYKKGLFFGNYLFEPFINAGNRMRMYYEASFLSRLFPCANIRVKLQK